VSRPTGRPCSICTHAERAAIDRALASGASYRDVAKQFGVSHTAVYRHRKEHVPVALAQAVEAQAKERELRDAAALLAELDTLHSRTLTILERAERTGDLRTALGAIREARANVALIGEVLQLIDRRPVVNILALPEWQAVRGVLLTALAGFPDARIAVARALSELESGDAG
jgi:transposase-like protein